MALPSSSCGKQHRINEPLRLAAGLADARASFPVRSQFSHHDALPAERSSSISAKSRLLLEPVAPARPGYSRRLSALILDAMIRRQGIVRTGQKGQLNDKTLLVEFSDIKVVLRGCAMPAGRPAGSALRPGAGLVIER